MRELAILALPASAAFGFALALQPDACAAASLPFV
jgi:hypothetical protein